MVFVINKNKKPLCTISNAEARLILKDGNAVVHRTYPFTIRLKKQVEDEYTTHTVKIDPGSKYTGIAIVDNNKNVIMLAEIDHRGRVIHHRLLSRRAIRNNRRARKTRYRKARFLNRKKPRGWLPPSVKSRVDNIINFIKNIERYLKIDSIFIEYTKFNTNIDYGVSIGKDVRKYLFNKYRGTCVYCGEPAQEIEHIIPRARGGTDCIGNLAIACTRCNRDKGKKSLIEFSNNRGTDFSYLQNNSKNRDGAIVNAYMDYMVGRLSEKYNVCLYTPQEVKESRKTLGLPKEHYYDALAIGNIGEVHLKCKYVNMIVAMGRGRRQLVDKYGFPKGSVKTAKYCKGFQTGDHVKAKITKGMYIGNHVGRVTIRSKGSFVIHTNKGVVVETSPRNISKIQHSTGYIYTTLKS